MPAVRELLEPRRSRCRTSLSRRSASHVPLCSPLGRSAPRLARVLYCAYDGFALIRGPVCGARGLLENALEKVVTVCGTEPEVREAFVFGSFATGRVGPTSDLDVLIVRDTELGIVDRVADLKLAAQDKVGLDIIVVTPQEYCSTFAASSFGRTVLAQAKRVYAA
jgi:predicted nucleotidyltransferase